MQLQQLGTFLPEPQCRTAVMRTRNQTGRGCTLPPCFYGNAEHTVEGHYLSVLDSNIEHSLDREDFLRKRQLLKHSIRKFLLRPVPACGGLSPRRLPFPLYLRKRRKVETRQACRHPHTSTGCSPGGGEEESVKTALLCLRHINSTPNISNYFQRAGKL